MAENMTYGGSNVKFWNCEYGARFAVGSPLDCLVADTVLILREICQISKTIDNLSSDGRYVFKKTHHPMGLGTTQALKGSKGKP